MTPRERLLLAWKEEALSLPEPVPDFPPEPINLQDEWWRFLDRAPITHKRKSKVVLEELVP